MHKKKDKKKVLGADWAAQEAKVDAEDDREAFRRGLGAKKVVKKVEL